MNPGMEGYLGHLANQIFANHLLVKKIWRHFSLKELKSLSLVCRQFCAISRETLRSHQFTTIAISAYYDCPCERLQTAEEIIGKCTDIPYNSISLFKPKEFECVQKISCSEICLKGNVEELFPKIIKFKNWKSIDIFMSEGNQKCSTLQLFWTLMFQNAGSIKRLGLQGDFRKIQKTLDDLIKIKNIGAENESFFPELEIFDFNIDFYSFNTVEFIISSAPKLRTMRGPIILQYTMSYSNRPPSFSQEKWGLIREGYVKDAEELLPMATSGLRLEKLKLTESLIHWGGSAENFQTSLTLPQQMFTKTMRKLSSCCDNVAFIATRDTNPWGNLESLTIDDYWGDNFDPPLISINQCPLTAIDFDCMFPRLRKMSIKFLPRPFGFNTTNLMSFKMGVYKSISVTHLKLIHKLSEECLAEIARIFPSVELLEIIDLNHVPLATQQDLQKLFRFWGSKGNFICLKKLRLKCSLAAVRIDDYLGYSDEMRKFGDVEFWRKFRLAPKGFSIFNKDDLNSVEIFVRRSGDREVHDAKEATNIVTIHAAKLIRAKKPGFIIKLRFFCFCEQCQQINDMHFQHLKLFAKITHSVHVHGYPEIEIVFEDKTSYEL